MAARRGISQSKISKIETGEVPPSAVDVERILRALNASPEVTEEITALPRLANTQFLDLRSTLRRGLCAGGCHGGPTRSSGVAGGSSQYPVRRHPRGSTAPARGAAGQSHGSTWWSGRTGFAFGGVSAGTENTRDPSTRGIRRRTRRAPAAA
ncbi:helix-turn-helix transcriptional regulator [Nonomuraea sp. NPDC048901]|uniref:helix-turn-helix domain-containing protein n=1 Tax=Nonomuraea sp. NPDC048901 TaxID=3155627 RepID=UPI0034014ACD